MENTQQQRVGKQIIAKKNFKNLPRIPVLKMNNITGTQNNQDVVLSMGNSRINSPVNQQTAA
jgi:hypothetical protein